MARMGRARNPISCSHPVARNEYAAGRRYFKALSGSLIVGEEWLLGTMVSYFGPSPYPTIFSYFAMGFNDEYSEWKKERGLV